MKFWRKADYLEESKRRFLHEEDNVFYLREYTNNKGYSFSETNNHISNFQKGLECNKYEKRYRLKAIRLFASELRNILIEFKDHNLITGMPPRQSPDDESYDDRLELAIALGIRGFENYTHVRLIKNDETREQLKDRVRDPNFLKNHFILNDDIDVEEFENLIIVDDTMVSGCSIRAVTEFLKERYPALNLIFVVWAKGIWISEDNEQI